MVFTTARGLLRSWAQKRELGLWILLVVGYIAGQALLYGQSSPASSAETPWEHLTLEAALAIGVVAQYRENRQKEELMRAAAKESAQAITNATNLMAEVTKALENLAKRIDDCPERRKPS